MKALDRDCVDHALAGALALAIHGAPRATTDIDLLIQPVDTERALASVQPLGFDVQAMPMRFSDGMEVRRVSKIRDGEFLTLDFLLVNPILESIWASRITVESDLGTIRVISREALIQMKAWAGRAQDLADIQRLKEMDR